MNEELKKFVLFELKKHPEINVCHYSLVVQHISGDVDLIKNGIQLSLEEKKRLGLNTRQKITKELLDLVNFEYIEAKNIVDTIHAITVNSQNKYSLQENINKFYEFNRSAKYELITPIDSRSCGWCLESNGKLFENQFDLISEINKNCLCQLFRGSVAYES